MPIEIRELVIKATVGDRNTGASDSGTTGNADSSEMSINEIAEKVFRIIMEKSER